MQCPGGCERSAAVGTAIGHDDDDDDDDDGDDGDDGAVCGGAAGVLDTCDRHLRGITIGMGPNEKGHSRAAGFDISVSAVTACAELYSRFRETCP